MGRTFSFLFLVAIFFIGCSSSKDIITNSAFEPSNKNTVISKYGYEISLESILVVMKESFYKDEILIKLLDDLDLNAKIKVKIADLFAYQLLVDFDNKEELNEYIKKLQNSSYIEMVLVDLKDKKFIEFDFSKDLIIKSLNTQNEANFELIEKDDSLWSIKRLDSIAKKSKKNKIINLAYTIYSPTLPDKNIYKYEQDIFDSWQKMYQTLFSKYEDTLFVISAGDGKIDLKKDLILFGGVNLSNTIVVTSQNANFGYMVDFIFPIIGEYKNSSYSSLFLSYLLSNNEELSNKTPKEIKDYILKSTQEFNKDQNNDYYKNEKPLINYKKLSSHLAKNNTETIKKTVDNKKTKTSSEFLRDDKNMVIFDKKHNLIWLDTKNTQQANFEQSRSYCQDLTVNGVKGWRLPTIYELSMLINNQKSFDVIKDGFKNFDNGKYWSNTINISDSKEAWFVNFEKGFIESTFKEKEQKIKCVKEQIKTDKKFTRDDSKQIVKDLATNLQWQDSLDTKTLNLTWLNAKKYCSSINIDNTTNWRLPSRGELQSIINYSNKDNFIFKEFKNSANGYYWTSTEVAFDINKAWHFNFGSWILMHNEKTNELNIRCVN